MTQILVRQCCPAIRDGTNTKATDTNTRDGISIRVKVIMDTRDGIRSDIMDTNTRDGIRRVTEDTSIRDGTRKVIMVISTRNGNKRSVRPNKYMEPEFR